MNTTARICLTSLAGLLALAPACRRPPRVDRSTVEGTVAGFLGSDPGNGVRVPGLLPPGVTSKLTWIPRGERMTYLDLLRVTWHSRDEVRAVALLQVGSRRLGYGLHLGRSGGDWTIVELDPRPLPPRALEPKPRRVSLPPPRCVVPLLRGDGSDLAEIEEAFRGVGGLTIKGGKKKPRKAPQRKNLRQRGSDEAK